jgi:hypothetical protein
MAKLKDLFPYVNGIDIIEEYYVVRVTYKPTWSVHESDNKSIIVSNVNDTMDGEYVYAGKKSDVEIEEIYDEISLTVEINRNAEKKFELLSQKILELKSIFAQETYEKLLYLTFAFERQKPTKKKTKKLVTSEEDSVKESVKPQITEPVDSPSNKAKQPKNKNKTVKVKSANEVILSESDLNKY